LSLTKPLFSFNIENDYQNYNKKNIIKGLKQSRKKRAQIRKKNILKVFNL